MTYEQILNESVKELKAEKLLVTPPFYLGFCFILFLGGGGGNKLTYYLLHYKMM